MKLTKLLTTSLLLVAAVTTGATASQPQRDADQTTILLEDFAEPKHKWRQMNDPVMGGRSTGTFSIANGVGLFEGTVVDVPKLKAPGFIKVASQDVTFKRIYPDVSSCKALQLTIKSSVFYDGYRVGFGLAHPPDGKFFAWGYKADLKLPKTEEFVTIRIPWNDFSDEWDDATGDAITTCKQDPRYCPDQKTLQDMKTISLWAKGVAGEVRLEVRSISAVGCSPDAGAKSRNGGEEKSNNGQQGSVRGGTIKSV